METITQLVRRVMGMDKQGRAVRKVLKAFEQMGADQHELKFEKVRLEHDQTYLSDWYNAVTETRKMPLVPRR